MNDTSTAQQREFVIITGMSGAGRETAARSFEDLGWFVVDNLPASLLQDFLHLEATERKIACVIDVRSRSYFEPLLETVREFKERNINLKVLFLDAVDEVLVRRFEQVRRPHPMSTDGSILDWIRQERLVLENVKNAADVLVDTSMFNVHQLTSYIRDAFAPGLESALHVRVMSFGFKYGIPLDADHVIDMRFLPNPYWDPKLRHLTGKDAAVSEFVLAQPNAGTFLERYVHALQPIFDGYSKENKAYVTIAVGCTGGKHRSVATTEFLSRQLTDLGLRTTVAHRDLGRE